jgi:DNA-binding response OmpR family regulator
MARILIIDDNENVNTMLQQVLSSKGYEVESVTSGEHGLSFLEVNIFDLIITDIIMPGKEGLEMILEIRKKNTIVPIIAISGGGKIGPELYLEMAHVFGAAYTFQKPFNIESFLEAVRECLLKKDTNRSTTHHYDK